MTSRLKGPWGTSGGRRMASSAAVSGVVHVAAVVLCGLWLLPFPEKPAHLAIETVWSDDGAPDILDAAPITVLSETSESGGSSTGAALFQHTQSVDRTDGAIDVQQLASLPLPEGDRPQPSMFTEAVSLGGGAGGGDFGLQGRGDGTGTGFGASEGGSRFFGQRVEGQRVVYVVDASRSMNHPHPGQMRTRFGRVKLELIRSIRQMTPAQEFFIVYFNDRALPMPANSMPRATPSAQEKFLRWAAQVRADGNTNPEQALSLALKLRPDVIYFLTDGNFPNKIAREVTQANLNRVVIHTIGFADDEGEAVLRAIATRNWGEYQFIPAAETGS